MLATIMVLVGAIVGQATYYNPGVFEDVWTQTRQYQMERCEECVGYAAMGNHKYLNKRIWVSNGKEWVGPLHVIDCGTFITPGRVVELDYWLAKRWGMVRLGPIPVTVVFEEDFHGQGDDRPGQGTVPGVSGDAGGRPSSPGTLQREVPHPGPLHGLARL